jgi:sentrin-specific protease 8
MAFMLMQTPNALSLKDVLPDFSKTTHIFLPINDARNVSVAEGGSHWSLLLVSVIDGVAFHYDSMTPSNYAEAQGATRQLSTLLGRGLKFLNLDDSPQQENGSDCGVYVCILMRHLLMKKLLSANAREKVSMSMGGKLVDASGGRKEILRTIEGFRREGERRRSYVAPHHILLCPRFPYEYRVLRRKPLRRPSNTPNTSSSESKTISTSSRLSSSPKTAIDSADIC